MQQYLPQSELILQTADRACSDAMEINRMVIAVIHEAARLEPDSLSMLRWYTEDPIESLGGRTACQLIMSGHGELVVRFLRHIARADINR